MEREQVDEDEDTQRQASKVEPDAEDVPKSGPDTGPPPQRGDG